MKAKAAGFRQERDKVRRFWSAEREGAKEGREREKLTG